MFYHLHRRAISPDRHLRSVPSFFPPVSSPWWLVIKGFRIDQLAKSERKEAVLSVLLCCYWCFSINTVGGGIFCIHHRLNTCSKRKLPLKRKSGKKKTTTHIWVARSAFGDQTTASCFWLFLWTSTFLSNTDNSSGCWEPKPNSWVSNSDRHL